MKRYTKKQFEEKAFKVIEELNYDELQLVWKGLYVLYNKLKVNTDTLKIERMNDLSYFLYQLIIKVTDEDIKRDNFENKVPY